MVQSVNSANESDLFAVSLLTPWVKGSITVDNAFIRVNIPNTVLFGLVPAGKNKDSSPLSGVTNVYTSKSYKLGAMFLGILLAIISFALFSTSFLLGLILLVIGVVLVAGGIRTTFTYERSGITKIIEFPFFEANHVDELEEQVTTKLQQYQDDRNGRMNTEKEMHQTQQSAQKIVDAVKGKAGVPTDTAAANTGSFCPHCGAMVPAGGQFCTHCGTKVE